MFTYINRVDGKAYDVLSYDEKNNMALLHSVGVFKENHYIVVYGLNDNTWDKESEKFFDYDEAHNYFVKQVYNSLEYKQKFINTLEEEYIDIDGIDIDSLYARWMDDPSITGFIDREAIERIVEEEKREINNSYKNETNDTIKTYGFLDDKDKMRDFHILSKEEFLTTYSYIDDEEYMLTYYAVQFGKHLVNEGLNKRILEKTINVFSEYRIVKADDKDGIYVVRIGDNSEALNDDKGLSFKLMKEIIPEEDQYFYSTYREALTEWLIDIKNDIKNLGLFFPNENINEYSFYLTPEELVYCGFEKELIEDINKLSDEEMIQLAIESDSALVLDDLSKSLNVNVRTEVAANVYTSYKTLDELSSDSINTVGEMANNTIDKKHSIELNHIKELFNNDSDEYFIYDNENRRLKTIWFNEDGNDGVGTIRIDYYPYAIIYSRRNQTQSDKFYADYFYDSNYDMFDHESIEDLSKIDEILSSNAIKIDSNEITIEEILKTIESQNENKNTVFDSKRFGKIIQDMVDLANSSENNTWFLEYEDFKNGTYTQDDLDELAKDIDKLRDLGVDDIYSIIETYEKWQEAEDNGDPVAIFYGSFINLFQTELEDEVLNEKDSLDLSNLLNDEIIINNIKYIVEVGDSDTVDDVKITNFYLQNTNDNFGDFYMIQVAHDLNSLENDVSCNKYVYDTEGNCSDLNWANTDRYLSGDLKTLEAYFIIRAEFIRSLYLPLNKVDLNLRTKAICLDGIRQDGDFYKDVPDILVNDEFNLECVKRNIFVIEQFSKEAMSEAVVNYIKNEWNDYIPVGTAFPKDELTASICSKSLIDTSQWDFNKDVPNHLKDDVIEELENYLAVDILRDIASDSNTDINILLKLRDSKFEEVGLSVKENPYYQNCMKVINGMQKGNDIKDILKGLSDKKSEYPVLKVIDELNAAIEHGLLRLDPSNKNNILVYRINTTNNKDGWYSMNIFDIASELVNDEKSYNEFKETINESMNKTTLIDKIDEIDKELSNNINDIHVYEEDDMEI